MNTSAVTEYTCCLYIVVKSGVEVLSHYSEFVVVCILLMNNNFCRKIE